jgi:hypothetical protein
MSSGSIDAALSGESRARDLTGHVADASGLHSSDMWNIEEAGRFHDRVADLNQPSFVRIPHEEMRRLATGAVAHDDDVVSFRVRKEHGQGINALLDHQTSIRRVRLDQTHGEDTADRGGDRGEGNDEADFREIA